MKSAVRSNDARHSQTDTRLGKVASQVGNQQVIVQSLLKKESDVEINVKSLNESLLQTKQNLVKSRSSGMKRNLPKEVEELQNGMAKIGSELSKLQVKFRYLIQS